jgi:hypothetical protein
MGQDMGGATVAIIPASSNSVTTIANPVLLNRQPVTAKMQL